MKILLSLLLALTFVLNSWTLAAASDQAGDGQQSKTTIIVFLDKFIFKSEKAMTNIKMTLSSKFKNANIVYYGDDKPKSPEFLEFTEKIKSDPANEEQIRIISGEYLFKYAQDTNSDNIVLITIQNYNKNSTQYWDLYDMKQQISVIDISSKKWVENIAWHIDSQEYPAVATEKFMKKLNTEFHWPPTNSSTSEPKEIQPPERKKLSVVVFLPNLILATPEAVEIVRKNIAEKFKVSDIPIYVDNKPKTSEFLSLVDKVAHDSAKQKTFLLKKEHLVEYGKRTNSDLIIAINFGVIDYSFNPFGVSQSVQLKEDIYLVDVASNKYILNSVFNTDKRMNRTKAVEYLLEKMKNEFNIPIN